MAYKLRFVQHFDKRHEKEFWECEKKFAELEKANPGLKRGRRFAPILGKEPVNTMIWEGEYESEKEALEALAYLSANDEHDKLLDEQIKYMRDNYVELYQEKM